MAVPAHDERDFEFAQTYELPIRPVVLPPRAWLESTFPFRLLQKLNAQSEAELSSASVPTMSLEEADVVTKSLKYGDRFGDDIAALALQLYRDHVELFDCFAGEGIAINSAAFDGTPTAAFKAKITAWLETQNKGKRKINYKLRDWLFSRQRYWGEPFPILHELDANGQPTGRKRTVPPQQLPLRLPEMDDYHPSGRPEPPLAKAKAWVEVEVDGKNYLRETNTMPQWAGSCWYYLRFIDARNQEAFADPRKLKTWLPVDLYVGGAEHAVLHLLYSRFWHKVLFDRGHVPCPEPFQRLVNQGMILGEMEFNGFQQGGVWVPAEKVDFDGDVAVLKRTETKLELVKVTEDQVEKKGDSFVLKSQPTVRIDARAYKMSKSRGNVINPDHVVAEYGADSLRLYEMFMGPLEATKPWSMRGVEGVFRFLNRVWRLVIDDRAETTKVNDTVQDVEPDAETRRRLHQAIKKVTDDLDNMSFNTAISAMMEFTNHLTPLTVRPKSGLKTFMLLLAPFAPHIAEELWQALGGQATLAYEAWPSYDAALLKADTIEVPIQINGKLRGKIIVPTGLDKSALEAAALADDKIKSLLDGKSIKKVIAVPGKMVNIVIG
jgi:leucyl-tRNA synthetase